jgi:hypothetical protein
VTDSNELVDATATSGAEPSDSDRMYLLRSDHYVGVQIGAMRGDHIGLHPKTQQEAYQRRGEIAATRTTDEAGIILKGEQSRPTMLAQKLGYHLQQRFGIKLSSDLPMEPDRGACIHKVGNLDHMLSLAIWISRHEAFIFEIELDFLSWRSRFQRLGFAAANLWDTTRLTQDLPDGRLRAWQAHAGIFERWITMQIIQDRFWSRDAVQVLWRCETDLHDALHDGWL